MTKGRGPVREPIEPRYNPHDDGCEIAKSCLDCPLPECVYDNPAGVQKARKIMADQPIIQALKEGQHPREIARTFGCTERNVYRIKKEKMEPLGHPPLVFVCRGCQTAYKNPQDLLDCVERHNETKRK